MNNDIHFSTYHEATSFLFSQLPMYQQVGKIAYKADLNTPLQLDKYFDFPHKKYRTIHVAGTNGKGSTSHMLAAVLQTAGYKVGLYTSPHLKDFRERIKINGISISETEVLSFVNKHWQVIEQLQPSFFEMTAALAFDYFATQKVDVAIIETGMGGRLDATNIISPVLSIITNIGLDHTEHLGDTLSLIAREKAGIIKPQTPIVIGEYDAETAPVFLEIAKKQNASLVFANQSVQVIPKGMRDFLNFFQIFYSDAWQAEQLVSVDLLGDYQQKNIATVFAALKILQTEIKNPFSISLDVVKQGLSQTAKLTGLRGRWEILSRKPMTICDIGHNAHGLQNAFAQLRAIPHKQLHIVFGIVADKDLTNILPLMPRDAIYYFTQANLPRALAAECLAEQCKAVGLQGETIIGVPQAIALAKSRAAKDDVIYIGGSAFVVAEAI